MQRKYNYLILLLIGTAIMSCSIKPDFPIEPELIYVGLSTDTMEQSNLLSDSLFLFFDFKDGDGDIGFADDEFGFNLVLTDNRTGNIFDRFKTPLIPEQGASNGVEGSVQLKVYTTCCIFNETIPPCSAPPQFPMDTLTLDIQLEDRAGHFSNVITSEPILLLCN